MCSWKSMLSPERRPAALVLEVRARRQGENGRHEGGANQLPERVCHGFPPLVSYLTWISPRIDRCRSQKYGYTPRWVSSTVAVAPLPTSWWLNLPSRLSGVPDVMVWVMSSW